MSTPQSYPVYPPPPAAPKAKREFPTLVAGVALITFAVGLGAGAVAPRSPETPVACIEALDRSQVQYTQLESVLPVAADAVGAAVRRSVRDLDDATDRINSIKDKLDDGRLPLAAATEQCRAGAK